MLARGLHREHLERGWLQRDGRKKAGRQAHQGEVQWVTPSRTCRITASTQTSGLNLHSCWGGEATAGELQTATPLLQTQARQP